MALFTTGFTATQLAALEQNIALGVLSVDHNGKKTTFQSLAAMMTLRDRIKAELAQATATTSPSPSRAPCMSRPTIFVR